MIKSKHFFNNNKEKTNKRIREFNLFIVNLFRNCNISVTKYCRNFAIKFYLAIIDEIAELT